MHRNTPAARFPNEGKRLMFINSFAKSGKAKRINSPNQNELVFS